jgi:polysaccharide export outer membrane protein
MWHSALILLALCALSMKPSVAAEAGRVTESAAPLESYILGPEDQILVRVFHADEFPDKAIQIGNDGLITLPFLGDVKAAGLTVRDLERTIAEGLSKYVRRPQVTVSVAEYRSQPVSVLGAFTNPGVQQVRGSRTLLQMIALAGGLRADAGNQATIVRQKEWGAIPLPSAHVENGGQVTVAVINLKDVLSARHPEQDIVIRPYDTISVPRAALVYVAGEVTRAGGFPLQEAESVSVLQALALAGGMTRTASSKHARILRAEAGRPDRQEISVDLQKVAQGTAPDVALKADDILFIPNNLSKSAAIRAAEAALNIGTGIAIFGR